MVQNSHSTQLVLQQDFTLDNNVSDHCLSTIVDCALMWKFIRLEEENSFCIFYIY